LGALAGAPLKRQNRAAELRELHTFRQHCHLSYCGFAHKFKEFAIRHSKKFLSRCQFPGSFAHLIKAMNIQRFFDRGFFTPESFLYLVRDIYEMPQAEHSKFPNQPYLLSATGPI
jgi:hypothetical protein